MTFTILLLYCTFSSLFMGAWCDHLVESGVAKRLTYFGAWRKSVEIFFWHTWALPIKTICQATRGYVREDLLRLPPTGHRNYICER